MTYLPKMSAEELALFTDDTAVATNILWAARLEFPTLTGVQSVVAGWTERVYFFEAAGALPDKTMVWHGWACTACAGGRGEDCIHASTVRRMLIELVRAEARSKFQLPEDHQMKMFSSGDDWLYDPQVAADTVWWYWNEVMEDRRAMGQVRAKSVWTMTLKEVLGLEFGHHFDQTFALLERQRRLTLDGTIVASYADRMAEFAELEKTTGHAELHTSDFGGWACHACYVQGDEYTDPSNTACIRKELTSATVWQRARDGADNGNE